MTPFELLQSPEATRKLGPARAKPYSVIRHIAGAISPNRNPNEFLMTVFNAYFDASGSSKDKLSSSSLFVSGFVSTETMWGKFETRWLTLLDRYGITPPFHMTDFEDGKGQYEHWKNDEQCREEFLIEAIRLINKHTHKPISVGVVTDDLTRAYKTFIVPPERELAAFAYCGRQAFFEITKWTNNRVKRNPHAKRDELSVVLRRGITATISSRR